MKPVKLTRAIKVFYSYAQEDEKLQEELVLTSLNAATKWIGL